MSNKLWGCVGNFNPASLDCRDCRDRNVCEYKQKSDRENTEAIQKLKEESIDWKKMHNEALERIEALESELLRAQQDANDYKAGMERTGEDLSRQNAEIVRNVDAAIQQTRRDTAKEIFKELDIGNFKGNYGYFITLSQFEVLRAKYLPEG